MACIGISIECDFASSVDEESSTTQHVAGGELSFDNLSAVVSPNIYVTGSGGSTNWTIGEGGGPVVTALTDIIDRLWRLM
jgi:hypothetical protein